MLLLPAPTSEKHQRTVRALVITTATRHRLQPPALARPKQQLSDRDRPRGHGGARDLCRARGPQHRSHRGAPALRSIVARLVGGDETGLYTSGIECAKANTPEWRSGNARQLGEKLQALVRSYGRLPGGGGEMVVGTKGHPRRCWCSPTSTGT